MSEEKINAELEAVEAAVAEEVTEVAEVAAAPKKRAAKKKVEAVEEVVVVAEPAAVKKPQRLAKEQTVEGIKQLINDSQGLILIDYKGITVDEDTKLRRRMREAGVVYKVEKNTLIKRAYGDLGFNDLDPFLEGTTAMAFSNDPVMMAKTISQFMTEFKKLHVKAGMLDNKFMQADQVDKLAKLPSREVLLSQLLGSMQSPMASFAGVCSGMLRQLVTVVDKVREQKEA